MHVAVFRDGSDEHLALILPSRFMREQIPMGLIGLIAHFSHVYVFRCAALLLFCCLTGAFRSSMSGNLVPLVRPDATPQPKCAVRGLVTSC